MTDAGSAPGGGGIKIIVDDPLKMAFIDTSDLGNAKRLQIISRGRLLWIEEEKAWAYHDNQRWSFKAGTRMAQNLAHDVVAHIDEEANAIGAIADDPIALKRLLGDWCSTEIAAKRAETLRGHAVRSGSAGMTTGMLKQAQSFLPASIDDFDTDPLAYNVQNGTLRFALAGGKPVLRFAPHDPVDMIMQLADVEYHPDAECPFWQSRLAMLQPLGANRDAMQRLYGYTLTGLVSDQKFYVHQGRGGDGKSGTHALLRSIHGDYYRHAAIETFLESRQRGGAEHRSDLVALKGDIRFICCDEPPGKSVFDGKTMKQITGSIITARAPNATKDTTFKPRGKVHIECNIIPRAPSDDKGFRRRFGLFRWKVSIADTAEGELPEDLIAARLNAEKPGVLNWLIEGALAWLETRKIPVPEDSADLLAEYWADSSPLLEWMGEWCDTSDIEAKAPAKELHAHFKAWCEERGIEKVMTPTAFGIALRDKQHGKWRHPKGGATWRCGIRLRTTGLFGDAPPVGGDGDAAGTNYERPGDYAGDSDLDGFLDGSQ